MSEIWFWMAKPLAELMWLLVIMTPVLCLYALAVMQSYLRQRKCKHSEVREDQACNAWCCNCGKKLGFIGDWRKQ